MAFVQRQLDVTITLGTGDFGAGTGNTVTLTGYRVSATIQKFGQPSTDAAEVRVYGISASQLRQLSQLGKPFPYVRNNRISISAGDAQSGMSVVYSGMIYTSYADFDAAPDVCLVVTAFYDLISSAKAITPLSFPGPSSVAVIAAQLAAQMGITFVNQGVNVTVPGSVYLAGSAKAMLDKLQQIGNFEYSTNGGVAGQSLIIWPKGSSQGAQGPLISPATGLVGYPKFADTGVIIRAVYQPGFSLGTPFVLKSPDSVVQGGDGTWFVYSLTYDLEANNPTGPNPWFMDIMAQRQGYAA